MSGNTKAMQHVARRKTEIALAFFLPIICITALLLVILYRKELRPVQENFRRQARNVVTLQKNEIGGNFSLISADLLFLAGHAHLQEVFASPAVHQQNFTSDLALLSSVAKVYDQVRVLDSSGMELIRVNYMDGRSIVDPGNQLQFKGDRYYFKETISLGKGDVFVSPLDLNVEHDRIEQPLKPTLRFGTPVFDSAGRKQGILIFNYLAEKLRRNFKGLATGSPGQYMLLNQEGYWLVGSNVDQEWGFMYADGKQKTMGNKYPDAWRTISASDAGQFLTRDGLFTFATVYPQVTAGNAGGVSAETDITGGGGKNKRVYGWKIVSLIPEAILGAEERSIRNKYGAIFMFLLLFQAVGSWFAVEKLFGIRQKEQDLQRYGDNLEKEVLERTADLEQSAMALRNELGARKQAEEKMQQNLREMTALHDLAQQISADSTFVKIVDASLDKISRLVKPDLLLFFKRNGENLELLKSGPVDSPVRHDKTPDHHVGDCLCGLAASFGKPIYSADIHCDARCTWEECKKAGIRSFAALPLVFENKVLGVISLASLAKVDFEQQGSFLEALSGGISLGLKNALLIEEVVKHSAELEQEVAERKQAEEELRLQEENLEKLVAARTRELASANEQLKEIDRLKSMFIASMSHELRTPLNSVIGFSSIMLNEWIGALNDEQKKSLSSILRSGKHLLSLINDVIDVSKIEAGMIEVNRDDFDLAELLSEVEQAFAKEAQERKLALSVQKPKLLMCTDRRRLLQCLFNLVGNAVKYTERGGVNVSVRLDEEPGEVTIAVSDSGIGIGLADQVNLFQAFSRIQSPLTAKVLGTGLGLYLTRKITVEILGGTIGVTSQPGGGSTFFISIPIWLEEDVSPNAADSVKL